MTNRDRTKPKREPKKKLRTVKKSAGDKNVATRPAETKSRDLRSVIKKLDVTSLHSDDITDIMLHCAAALSLRKVLDGPAIATAQSSAGYCYDWAGDDNIVVIRHGRDPVGKTTKEDAEARGIRPCG